MCLKIILACLKIILSWICNNSKMAEISSRPVEKNSTGLELDAFWALQARPPPWERLSIHLARLGRTLCMEALVGQGTYRPTPAAPNGRLSIWNKQTNNKIITLFCFLLKRMIVGFGQTVISWNSKKSITVHVQKTDLQCNHWLPTTEN